MPVLDQILHATRASLPTLRANRAALERAAAQRLDPPDFTQGFRRGHIGLIAEVKRRSPSAGAINESLDPVALTLEYARGGASAISVLTEPHYFGGSLADLAAVVGTVEIPVLRKDFILDETQLLEARAAGASAALLIVRALDQAALIRLHQFATDLGLTPLVETHSLEEVTRALDAGAEVIGVNARDLDTLIIDTTAAWRLLRDLPPGCIAIAESGMASGADVEAAAVAGADGVLIGAALASAVDPASRARECSAVVRRGR